MRKQEQHQKQVFASALVLLLLGITATASPGAAAKSNKTHRVHGHTQRPAHPAAQRGIVSQSAGQVSRAAVSPGAAGGPLRFTPQQWQDYGEMMRRESSSGDLTKQGDADAGLGNWTQAAQHYQDALALWPDNPEGLYGLGQCAAARGDLTQAVSYYRLAIYTKEPGYVGMVPGSSFQTNDVERLMQFVLLLGRAGQAAEGVLVYNRAALLLDYEGESAPVVKVLLPELAVEPTQPNQVQYTPERLQALADTALARQGFDYKVQRVYIQEAVKLYPDSAVIQYYLGEALSDSYYHTLEHPAPDKVAMTAAYNKTIELGDDQAVAAAKERLSMYP